MIAIVDLVDGERTQRTKDLHATSGVRHDVAILRGQGKGAHGVEIVPRNQLLRVGMYAVNAHFVGHFGGLVAVAAANGRDLPTLRTERRNVDLGAKAEADNADLSIRWGHLLSGALTIAGEARRNPIMIALHEQRRDRRPRVDLRNRSRT